MDDNVWPIRPTEGEELERAMALLDAPAQEPVIYTPEEQARIDGNFRVLEEAILEMPAQEPHATGSQARIDPDDIRLFWVTLGLTAAFATAAFAASFSGQYAMAANTYLPNYLRFVVPLFIDMPIIVVSLSILIFRRRRQSTLPSWILLGTLTSISSTINAVHVLAQAGILAGQPLTLPVALGAGVMAAAPILVLVAWEEMARLAVKPLQKNEI
jgi:hypothetical protein